MNVYIGGDSWGCGEWAWRDKENKIQHGGLAQYLEDDGHSVTNKSVPGGTNLKAYQKLAFTRPDVFDIIILFQTVSLRDLDNWETLITWKDFVNINEDIKQTFYSKLGSLPHKKIYLLGGLEKVQTSQIKQYPNLVPLIESIPEWLTDGKYKESFLTGIRHVIYDKISKNVNTEVFDNFDNNIAYWRDTVAADERYFQPDGWHPNRSGHRKIYNVLKQELKN